MADISDVEGKIAELIAGAIYPNGVSNASAIGAGARIYPGWPDSKNLDADLQSGIVNVSVFPMHGNVQTVPQNIGPEQVLTPAQHGISASIDGSTVSFSGAPTAGEYVTLLIASKSYSRVGVSLADILNQLLGDIVADFPGSTLSGTTLTIHNGAADDVRSGAPGVMVRGIRRIVQPFTITIWAPSPDLRHQAGSLVNNTLINSYRASLSDSSHLRLYYYRTDEWDNRENVLLYRRDLVFYADYMVTEQYPGYEVTSVITQWQSEDQVTGKPLGPVLTRTF